MKRKLLTINAAWLVLFNLWACAGVGGNATQNGVTTTVGQDLSGQETVSQDAYRPLVGGAPDMAKEVDEMIKLYVILEINKECTPSEDGKVLVKMTGHVVVTNNVPADKRASLEAALAKRWFRIEDTGDQSFKYFYSGEARQFSFDIVSTSDLPFAFYAMPQGFAPEPDYQGKKSPCPGVDCSGGGRPLPPMLLDCESQTPLNNPPIENLLN